MRFSGRVGAAIAFAAACFGVCLSISTGPSWAGGDGAQLLLFSGGDLWSNGAFTNGGLLWSPGGLDREGFTLKTVLSGGVYRYHSGALSDAQVVGSEYAAQVLPGWRFKRDGFEAKVFLGVDLQNNRLSPDDPSSRLRGTNFGARTAVDLWYEPTPASMIAADASISSIATSYSARLAYGWRMFERFYFGPEAQAYACDGYRQMRVGAHVTAFKTETLEWSLAAGLSEDSDRRTSPYLRLGVLTRR